MVRLHRRFYRRFITGNIGYPDPSLFFREAKFNGLVAERGAANAWAFRVFVNAFTAKGNGSLVARLVRRHRNNATSTAANAHRSGLPILQTGANVFRHRRARRNNGANDASGRYFAHIRPLQRNGRPIAFRSHLLHRPAPIIFAGTPTDRWRLLANVGAQVFTNTCDSNGVSPEGRQGVASSFSLANGHRHVFVIRTQPIGVGHSVTLQRTAFIGYLCQYRDFTILLFWGWHLRG